MSAETQNDIINVYGRKANRKEQARNHRHAEDDHASHKGGGGHGGDELWIFSYADLITNLLLFFIMMFAISNVDKGKFDQLSEAIRKDDEVKDKDAKKKAPEVKISQDDLAEIDKSAGMSKNSAIMQVMQQLMSQIDTEALQKDQKNKKEFDNVKEKLKEIAKSVLENQKGQHSFDVVFPTDKFFVAGSERPSPEAIAFLRKLSGDLKGLKNRLAISVEGHTDSTELPTWQMVRGPDGRLAASSNASQSRWELSARRASAVIDVLKASGLKSENWSISGYSDTRPLLPERAPQGQLIARNQSFNRRVNIKITRLMGEAKGDEKGADSKMGAIPKPANVERSGKDTGIKEQKGGGTDKGQPAPTGRNGEGGVF